MKKVVIEDYYARTNPHITREEVENMALERERLRESLAEFVHVERVIGDQVSEEGNQEYMIKCEFDVTLNPLLTDAYRPFFLI